jgi:hypothetical protein
MLKPGLAARPVSAIDVEGLLLGGLAAQAPGWRRYLPVLKC